MSCQYAKNLSPFTWDNEVCIVSRTDMVYELFVQSTSINSVLLLVLLLFFFYHILGWCVTVNIRETYCFLFLDFTKNASRKNPQNSFCINRSIERDQNDRCNRSRHQSG